MTAQFQNPRPGDPSVRDTRSESVGTSKLNVIFHGMFAYVIWPDHIEVLAPQEEDHVYKAGSWGRERRLKEGGTYSLRGVNPGTDKLTVNPNENLVLSEMRNIDRSPDVLFFSLRLPLPERMTGLRRVNADPQRRFFGGKASTGLIVKRLPLIQVLTYAVDTFEQVRLDPMDSWKPARAPDGTANLHIWAESDSLFTEAERNHPIHGFQQLVRLFPDLDLELLYSTGAPPEQPTGVPGLEVWEQATLRERSQLMVGLPDQSAEEGSRGAEVTNCLSLIVLNDSVLN